MSGDSRSSMAAAYAPLPASRAAPGEGGRPAARRCSRARTCCSLHPRLWREGECLAVTSSGPDTRRSVRSVPESVQIDWLAYFQLCFAPARPPSSLESSAPSFFCISLPAFWLLLLPPQPCCGEFLLLFPSSHCCCDLICCRASSSSCAWRMYHSCSTRHTTQTNICGAPYCYILRISHPQPSRAALPPVSTCGESQIDHAPQIRSV